jgi:hypothetical protein
MNWEVSPDAERRSVGHRRGKSRLPSQEQLCPHLQFTQDAPQTALQARRVLRHVPLFHEQIYDHLSFGFHVCFLLWKDSTLSSAERYHDGRQNRQVMKQSEAYLYRNIEQRFSMEMRLGM